MAFNRKNWQNKPIQTTPINAEAMEDMEERLSDYTDLRTGATILSSWFGTVSDGSDDSAALQEALDAAGSVLYDGATVLVPPGEMGLEDEVSVPNKVNLWGAGKRATEFSLSGSGCIKFGDGGGVATTENYGGISGNFRINGNSSAAIGMFVGLCVARTFQSIDIGYCVDGLVIEQGQNMAFIEVDSSHNTGSGIVQDYGAGGNAFYKCESNLNRRNYYQRATGINTSGKGYSVVNHTLFSHCLFEGTRSTSEACVDIAAGTRTVFHSCHMTLFSGATGHADLYGTNIPVLRIAQDNADSLAGTYGVYLTGNTNVIGSKPAASSAYKGIGIDISCAPGVAGWGSVFIDRTVNIQYCDYAIKALDTSIIENQGATFLLNTNRFGNNGGGSAAEATISRMRTPNTTTQATDSTADIAEWKNSAGSTILNLTAAGTLIGAGAFAPDLIKTASRGAVGTPAHTFSNDLDTGMYSPGVNDVALVAGGAEKVRANGTGLGFNGATPVAKPTVSGSRGSNAALASLLTALANLGLITDSSS